MRNNSGNAVVGVVVSLAIVAFGGVWIYLGSQGVLPDIGLGIQISAPVLVGALVLLAVIAGVVFFSSGKKRANIQD